MNNRPILKKFSHKTSALCWEADVESAKLRNPSPNYETPLTRIWSLWLKCRRKQMYNLTILLYLLFALCKLTDWLSYPRSRDAIASKNIKTHIPVKHFIFRTWSLEIFRSFLENIIQRNQVMTGIEWWIDWPGLNDDCGISSVENILHGCNHYHTRSYSQKSVH